jgi:hypothetical protein
MRCLWSTLVESVVDEDSVTVPLGMAPAVGSNVVVGSEEGDDDDESVLEPQVNRTPRSVLVFTGDLDQR